MPLTQFDFFYWRICNQAKPRVLPHLSHSPYNNCFGRSYVKFHYELQSNEKQTDSQTDGLWWYQCKAKTQTLYNVFVCVTVRDIEGNDYVTYTINDAFNIDSKLWINSNYFNNYKLLEKFRRNLYWTEISIRQTTTSKYKLKDHLFPNPNSVTDTTNLVDLSRMCLKYRY